VIWPRPLARDPWELRLQRLALAALVVVRFYAMRRFTEQSDPVGIARWIDFSFLGQPAAEPWVTALLLLCAAFYAAGRMVPLALAGLVALWVGAGALAYSQGGLEHHTQLLGMVMLAQLLAHGTAWWARRRGGRVGDRIGADDLAVDYTLQVIAAAYLLAGLSKIWLSHGEWLAQAPLIAIDVAKKHGQAFCSTLDAGMIGRGDAIAAAVLAHPGLTRVFLGSALLLELAAPVALLGRLAAFALGAGWLVMHAAVATLMLINFHENEGLLLIYLVNVPYLLVRVARAVRARRGRGAPALTSRARRRRAAGRRSWRPTR